MKKKFKQILSKVAFYSLASFYSMPAKPIIHYQKKSITETQPSISILLPTYKRTQRLRSMLDSVAETISGELSIEIVIYTDFDDLDTIGEMDGLLLDYPALNLNFLVGEKAPIATCWNMCCEFAGANIYFLGADDLLFRTQNWDLFVIQRFDSGQDNLIMLHGDDGYFGQEYGTHFFLHSDWVDAVGYFVPPWFAVNFVDTWLNEVANLIGRRFFIDLKIEHMHPLSGKASSDATYALATSRSKSKLNDWRYESMRPDRIIDSLRIRVKILEITLMDQSSHKRTP